MILLFNHEGYEVATSSWTASFSKGKMDVAYLWGADYISMFGGATSVRRTQFRITNVAHLLSRAHGDIIDLRGKEV